MRRTYRYTADCIRGYEVARAGPGAHNLMIDAYANNPIKSPIDGRVLDNRAKLREHNLVHDVVDVGNDGAARRMQKPAAQERIGEDLRGDLERAYSKIDVCR